MKKKELQIGDELFTTPAFLNSTFECLHGDCMKLYNLFCPFFFEPLLKNEHAGVLSMDYLLAFFHH